MLLMITLTMPKLHALSQNPIMTGATFAILSNVLFAVLYAYGKWLEPLSGTGIFLWRMIMAWLCLMTVLIASGKLHGVLGEIISVVRSNTKTIKDCVLLLLPTPIFASQLWLFMYAPLNGLGVQVSMGYFMFPLVMVAVGFFAGEQLSKLQKMAVVLAVLGVIGEFIRLGEIGIATLWVCLTYPIYYVIRRRQGVGALAGLLADTSIIAPFCLYWLLTHEADMLWTTLSSAGLFAKVVGLGVISILALQSSLEANRLLPSTLFGLLSYLEPALLFVVAITLLGGSFSLSMLATFGLIWLAIGCLLLQALWTQGLMGQKKTQRQA